MSAIAINGGIFLKTRNEHWPKISSIVPHNMRDDKEGELIKTCKSQNAKFTDPIFSTSSKSLVGHPPASDATSSWLKYKWARAEDIFGRGEYKVFNDVAPNDIR